MFTLCLTKVYSQGGPPVGTGNWTQTFNEDFKGITMASDKRSFTTLDGNTWITTFYWGNGAIGDGSLNYYTGNNVSCDGNNLVMKVSQELAAGTHPFAGGLANTDPSSGGSFSQKYGYYELRVKISMTNGDAPYAGVPPVNHAWPPETEMFESPYAWGQNGQLVHFLEKTATNDGPLIYDFGAGFHLQDAYHIFGYLWEPDYVVFYVDGIERGRSTWTSHSDPSFLNIGHGCGSDGGSWNGDAYAGTWPQNTYFDYFRVWTKDGSGTKVFVAPSAPTAISGDGKIAVSWSGSAGASSFNVKRSTTSGGSYSTIATVTSPFYMDNSVSNNTTYYYVVTGVKSGSETGNSKEASAKPIAGTNGTKIVGYGTVCGEPYSGSSDGYRAYDGDTNTYFDYITPNGAQTGMDVGSGAQATLAKIRFYPRGGFEGRMTGGKFQASNDNISFTDLYTISTQPSAGWNEVIVTSGSYRYFRYLSPIDSYGDVSEIEYYGTSSNNNVSVTGVSVAPASATINVGSTQQLTATVIPSNATNKSVNWSSSNASVATVNSSGLVTGVAAGTATITVTTVDGSKTATSSITVNSSGGNLVQNPGFETGSFSPWVNVWQSSITTGNAHTGSYCVTSWSGGSATQTVTVTPNTSYTLTLWGKLNGTGTASIYIKNYGGADLSAAITTTTYAQKTISFTTGSSNTNVLISVNAPSAMLYADDFSLTASGGTVTWVKVDDTDASIAYSSGWGAYIGNGGYLNTEHYVTLAAATATFTFTGTKARFYGFKRNDLGIAEISVDGVVQTTIDCYNSSMLVNQMLYETAALTSGSHTLKVKCTGTKNTSASSYQTIVDAFEYTTSTLKSATIETALVTPAKSGSDIDVMIYPNPVTEQTAVWVNSSEAVNVSVNICNVMGQIVWSIKTYALGDTKIPIDLNGQPKGIYVVKVQIGDKVVSKTIVK